VAILIDVVILAVPDTIIVSAVAGNALSAGVTASTIGSRVWEAIGVAVVVDLGYFSFLDGSRSGQTVGKMAMGIAVRDVESAGPLGAGRALLRRAFFFATYFGLILFVLNALSPLWDPRRRAWHDKLARSWVIAVR
jgi:uncharacterized RDD family membrane protein YckC